MIEFKIEGGISAKDNREFSEEKMDEVMDEIISSLESIGFQFGGGYGEYEDKQCTN